MSGLAASGAVRHHEHGNISYKISFTLLVGAFFGIRLGAAVVEFFKNLGNVHILGKTICAVDLFIPLAYLVMLIYIGVGIFKESRQALNAKDGCVEVTSAFGEKLAKLRIPPYIHIAESSHRISWAGTFCGSGCCSSSEAEEVAGESFCFNGRWRVCRGCSLGSCKHSVSS